MDLAISGHAAIVTGASRGLGQAIALGLAAEGVHVLAAARSTAELGELADESGGTIVPITCDMAVSEQVAGLASRAVTEFGRLDIVVNNAGIAPASPFVEMPLETWRQVLDVNVLAPVTLIQAALPHLQGQRSGKIINIGSLSSLRGKPLLAAYSASKGALLRLTEALAGEVAKDGIQVNLVAPGGFATEAQRQVLDDPQTLARRLRKIPTGRLGKPEEIVALVNYLASPLSGFVTGGTFTIDGGEFSKL
jgi:2-deoxy-D-gluconate 3-dehydrogenase